MGYYYRFMHNYAQIIASLEKLLNKDTKFVQNEEFQKSLDELKEKLVATSILVFQDWNKEFHVHVDASSIAFVMVLAQPGEGAVDHPIEFSSRKLITVEKNSLQQNGLLKPGLAPNFIAF